MKSVLIIMTHGLGDVIMYIPGLRLLKNTNVVYILYNNQSVVVLLTCLLGLKNIKFIHVNAIYDLARLKIDLLVGFNSSTLKVIALGIFLRQWKFVNILPYSSKTILPFIQGNEARLHKSELFGKALHSYLELESLKRAERGGGGGVKLNKILIAPGCAHKESHKRWPINYFVELIAKIHQSVKCVDFDVVVGPEEIDLGDYIKNSLADLKINSTIHSHLDIEKLIALVESYDLIIANDTFIGHLGGFLGVPVVSIYGPTDPLVTGAAGFSVTSELSCSPCYSRTNIAGCSQPICMQSILPDKVFKIIEENFSTSIKNVKGE